MNDEVLMQRLRKELAKNLRLQHGIAAHVFYLIRHREMLKRAVVFLQEVPILEKFIGDMNDLLDGTVPTRIGTTPGFLAPGFLETDDQKFSFEELERLTSEEHICEIALGAFAASGIQLDSRAAVEWLVAQRTDARTEIE